MTNSTNRLRLGVNIDHVATIRNARGGRHPDPLRAAQLAADAGADGITAHLREDRRHISDDDIARLSADIDLPLNLEMAATPEMLAIAVRHHPHAVCIVPEKRQEVTTEGGLDVASMVDELKHYNETLRAAGSRVSLFIDPEPAQIEASVAIGAPVIELHTGRYCDTSGQERARELERIKQAARIALDAGLEVHAGHGLTFTTVAPIAAIGALQELNIGHFLVGEAIMIGFDAAILKMRRLMDAARGGV
ncbi:MAG: pyridoxine 5'-phosphate synthase [Pseudomonadota bacterium]